MGTKLYDPGGTCLEEELVTSNGEEVVVIFPQDKKDGYICEGRGVFYFQENPKKTETEGVPYEPLPSQI